MLFRSSAIRLSLTFVVATTLLVGCQSTPSTNLPTTAAVIRLSPAVAGEITVDQLALLLPRHPVVVGFDVDDTLLFTAPAFNALQPQYAPDVIRPKNYDALTPAQKAKYHEFWNRLNGEFDERSVPKEIGKKLLALHVARGDEIWIISKRQTIDPAPATDVVTSRYERMFGMHFQHPIIQTQLKDKTPFIAARHIAYYYGDSDSDITSSVAAGAVPIRVKRGAGTYAKDAVHNGQLGEAVIADSDR
jgi:acid phosphatase (class B)